MNALLQNTAIHNGDQPTLNGRGLAHLKLSEDELKHLAADLATGQRPFQPSLAQTSVLTGVPVAAIRAEIKARTAQANNQEDDEIQRAVGSWERLSEEARRELFRVIGPAEVWDVLADVIV
jgi:hypothetical protein